MSELTSPLAVEKSQAQFSDEAFLILLTLSSPERAEPVRIVRNRKPIISRGNVFDAFPFQIGLPSDTDETPSTQLTIGNVSRKIGEEIERLIEPPQALVEIVLASTPDTVERAWDQFELTQSAWDAFRMTGTLQQLALWDEPIGTLVTEANFPGLFA